MPYSPTVWIDDSSPSIDAANLNNIETGVSKAAYAPDASSGFVPVGNGSGAWVYKKLTNAEIDSAAAIAYSKLNLAGSLVNADIATGAAVAYAKLNLAGAVKDSDIAAAQNLSKLSAVTGTPDGTKFLSDAGSWLKPAGLTTYRKSSAKTVNNTVVETDLLNSEITIAANAMGTTGVLRLTATGDWLENAGRLAWPQLKLKLGTTTLIDTGSGIGDNSGTAVRYGWKVIAEISNLGAANSQEITFTLFMGGAQDASNETATGAFTTGEGQWSIGCATAAHALLTAEAFNVSAIDTTSSQALVLSVINATASTSYEVKLYRALVEII